MTEHTKKKLIAGLLLVSCAVSGWLLFITPENDQKQLKSAAQADSLLRITLSEFNISDAQISTSTVLVDSTFRRFRYTVSVPDGFSKTQLHAALQEQLAPYSISLPGRIVFPDKELHIFLNYKQTVISKINLVTDKTLEIRRSYASMIAAFREQPPAWLMDTLAGFGEPIPVAVLMRTPLRLPAWWDNYTDNHPAPIIWPQTSNGDNLLSSGQQPFHPALKTVREEAADATLLHFFEDRQMASASLSKMSFSYIDARNAFILNAEAGRQGFSQTFRAFIRQSRNGGRPLAIIMASEKSLKWTRRELNTFKKGGLTLTPPRKVTFR